MTFSRERPAATGQTLPCHGRGPRGPSDETRKKKKKISFFFSRCMSTHRWTACAQSGEGRPTRPGLPVLLWLGDIKLATATQTNQGPHASIGYKPPGTRRVFRGPRIRRVAGCAYAEPAQAGPRLAQTAKTIKTNIPPGPISGGMITDWAGGDISRPHPLFGGSAPAPRRRKPRLSLASRVWSTRPSNIKEKRQLAGKTPNEAED